MNGPWPETVSASLLERSTQIGFCAEIFWQSGLPYQLGWIIPLHVVPAITLKQVAFHFDALGVPRAVIAWAFLSDEVHRELGENPVRPLHISEWNEGTNLWIMSLFGRKPYPAVLLRRMLSSKFSSFNTVSGYQRKDDGSIRRLVIWHRRRSPWPLADDRRNAERAPV